MDTIEKLDAIRRTTARDAALIVVGSTVYAIGFACFQAPYGLAAGGLTGLAMVIAHAVEPLHVVVPIGALTLLMNIILLAFAYRTGGMRYAFRSILGIIASSVLVDVFAVLMPALGDGDLLLCSLWGGVITGAGLGLCFRAGGNTGGTDILAQALAKRTSFSLGSAATAIDFAIIGASAFAFGLNTALYAAVSMFVCNAAIDIELDGLNARRAAFIISKESEDIKWAIMTGMDRGCTEIMARGGYSGKERPMLFVVLGRSEETMLKEMVSILDKDAIVIITNVHEAFGEGFANIAGE